MLRLRFGCWVASGTGATSLAHSLVDVFASCMASEFAVSRRSSVGADWSNSASCGLLTSSIVFETLVPRFLKRLR